MRPNGWYFVEGREEVWGSTSERTTYLGSPTYLPVLVRSNRHGGLPPDNIIGRLGEGARILSALSPRQMLLLRLASYRSCYYVLHV